MGCCATKALDGLDGDRCRQDTQRAPEKEANWIKRVKQSNGAGISDIVLTNGALLSIPQPLLDELNEFLLFELSGCQIYKNASDSIFEKAYGALEQRANSDVQVWRDAVRNRPSGVPGCSIELLEIAFNLPERAWSVVRGKLFELLLCRIVKQYND